MHQPSTKFTYTSITERLYITLSSSLFWQAVRQTGRQAHISGAQNRKHLKSNIMILMVRIITVASQVSQYISWQAGMLLMLSSWVRCMKHRQTYVTRVTLGRQCAPCINAVPQYLRGYLSYLISFTKKHSNVHWPAGLWGPLKLFLWSQ